MPISHLPGPKTDPLLGLAQLRMVLQFSIKDLDSCSCIREFSYVSPIYIYGGDILFLAWFTSSPGGDLENKAKVTKTYMVDYLNSAQIPRCETQALISWLLMSWYHSLSVTPLLLLSSSHMHESTCAIKKIFSKLSDYLGALNVNRLRLKRVS